MDKVFVGLVWSLEEGCTDWALDDRPDRHKTKIGSRLSLTGPRLDRIEDVTGGWWRREEVQAMTESWNLLAPARVVGAVLCKKIRILYITLPYSSNRTVGVQVLTNEVDLSA